MATLPDAQLSALAASIDELAERVAQLAEGLNDDGATESATALFEVERSLHMAHRAMDRARRSLAS